MMKHLRLFIQPGECGRKRMPYSEVCMHLQVAGRYMDFEVGPRSVQLYQDGHPYSAPILTGEAGLFTAPMPGLPPGAGLLYYYYPHEFGSEDDDAASEPPTSSREGNHAPT